jgi:S-DNA-T family DNA segregation ATPase FtsK/SpoIIIE
MQVPFGKMINGKYLAGDLTSFPHMLVAGSTGSGKSVFMHGVIMSLIMRNRPEDLKLVLIDPKRVEMGCYRDIPHLLCPIIKDPSQAKVCLDKLIIEMERRYSLFEWSGVRDIRQFNASFAPSHKLSPLPFIVVVVDEYADLVDTCKNVSDSVVRLAQKARAAGIHLIISTQRPSVDVITGVIKGNLSCRVALRVNSYVDSNTILGCGGAEGLSGYGDMLVDCQTAFQGGFSRAQGAIVDTEEIDKVCTFIKSQVPTVYDPNFLDLVDHEAEAEEEEAAAESMTPTHADIKAEDDEEFYQQLKAEIMTRQYTSISRIQREHGLGFPRAGRLFNRLVKEGVVAAEPNPPGSSKGCQVLIHADSNTGEVPGSTDASLKPGEDLHHGEQ